MSHSIVRKMIGEAEEEKRDDIVKMIMMRNMTHTIADETEIEEERDERVRIATEGPSRVLILMTKNTGSMEIDEETDERETAEV